MDEAEKPRSRRGTSGAASRRSSRTGGSRASSRARTTRLLSGNYLDDHSHYHHHPDEQSAIDDDSDSSSSHADDLSEKESIAAVEEGGLAPIVSSGSGDVAEEVSENRMGIQDVRDLEAGAKLEKSKSARSQRSVRDPNLVAWEGVDDPENPKNWSSGRKWAATLVGE